MSKNNSNITSHHFCGFWFHIKWNDDNIGYDQRNVLWTNKESPKCSNSNVTDSCLEGYINALAIK
jgi:hypothetical protein